VGFYTASVAEMSNERIPKMLPIKEAQLVAEKSPPVEP